MIYVYKDGVKALCDDSQLKLMLNAGWSRENAPKVEIHKAAPKVEIPKVESPGQIPVERVLAPTRTVSIEKARTPVQPRTQVAKPNNDVQNTTKFGRTIEGSQRVSTQNKV